MLDVEKIIGDYLRENMAVRVVATSPSAIEDPWVRITLIDDLATDGGAVNRSIESFLQIDCFAGRDGDKALARGLADDVRSLLRVAHTESFDSAVVSGAQTRISYQPDTKIEPEMPRYAVSASVWMHE